MRTAEDVVKLQPGREIDTLVAETVMGWEIEGDEIKLRRLNKYIAHDSTTTWWRDPKGAWYCDPSSYSSDIVAAWQVVQRMIDMGQPLFMTHRFDGYQVAFGEPPGTNLQYVIDESATASICKAALLAMMQLSSVSSSTMVERASESESNNSSVSRNEMTNTLQ